MPVYVFENKELGLRAELPFPVAERPEQIVLTRKTVPDTVAIAGSATSILAESSDLARAYKRLEERGALDPRNRGQGMSDAERKAALSLPPT
ncbi:MAG TPA: hypothetical protein VK178_07240 [Opitutaceae bacterium]|nr:hypothetical protein [Opitutaceae bacterium]HLP24892.1 hypothetical protein [Acidobacteriota bacterium]